jgi:hypothetical protein
MLSLPLTRLLMLMRPRLRRQFSTTRILRWVVINYDCGVYKVVVQSVHTWLHWIETWGLPLSKLCTFLTMMIGLVSSHRRNVKQELLAACAIIAKYEELSAFTFQFVYKNVLLP